MERLTKRNSMTDKLTDIPSLYIAYFRKQAQIQYQRKTISSQRSVCKRLTSYSRLKMVKDHTANEVEVHRGPQIPKNTKCLVAFHGNGSLPSDIYHRRVTSMLIVSCYIWLYHLVNLHTLYSCLLLVFSSSVTDIQQL